MSKTQEYIVIERYPFDHKLAINFLVDFLNKVSIDSGTLDCVWSEEDVTLLPFQQHAAYMFTLYGRCLYEEERLILLKRFDQLLECKDDQFGELWRIYDR